MCSGCVPRRADPVEAAPALLALADECNLPGLAAAAADFCVAHHAQVHERCLSHPEY